MGLRPQTTQCYIPCSGVAGCGGAVVVVRVGWWWCVWGGGGAVVVVRVGWWWCGGSAVVVLCCAVLCCAVVCCAVVWCAVLWCAVLWWCGGDVIYVC